jgi:hypothetical protein
MPHTAREKLMEERAAERETMTREELEALADRTARELLGVSADEAFKRLEAGEFDGQAVETPLRSIRRLLAA